MMKRCRSVIMVGTLVCVLSLMGSTPALARFLTGQTAPTFALKDLDGQMHDFANVSDQPLKILYFFDAKARISQEGLLSLNELAQKYKSADMLVWGITRSAKSDAHRFKTGSRVDIPILLDSSNVSDLFNARVVLPIVCIVGPRSKVLHHFQGCGKRAEILLTRLAEVQLQRGKPTLAAAISDQVIKENPKNVDAMKVNIISSLERGQPETARKMIDRLPTDQEEAKVFKQEGLAQVYFKTGDFEKAWASAEKLEQISPERARSYIIKGEILAQKGKVEEAEKELTIAAKKKTALKYQSARVKNRIGLIKARQGKNREAIELFSQGEEIDPYFIEATSNKGVALERQGQLDQALEAYRQALMVKKDDVYASVLIRSVQEKLTIENDAEKKKRMDSLIKSLADRYRQQKDEKKDRSADAWTSGPMVLSFINLKEGGGLPDRDGFVLVLADQLSDYLNSSGRLKVVERRYMEKILDELNLSTSELADPQTALKLGRLFAAKLICTGSIHYLPDQTLVSLRLMDTETSMIAKVFTRQIAASGALDRELGWLNKEILKTIISTYPLRGYIVDAKTDAIMINIGKNQGVVLGSQFSVLKDAEDIIYKGRKLKGTPETIARLEVTKVEPDFSLARIVTQKTPVQRDAKIEEIISEI
ncbi:tetratricopeptide repeat protein [Desulfosarcina variabilis]|uniref:tetratricopeptide repeat protein n=1 Tax=Desulfosarcina variabilis TaxID=2300 RepID=UPI003AFA7797